MAGIEDINRPGETSAQTETIEPTPVNRVRGRTLVVDDEEDMRILLRAVIDNEDRGLRVVAEAASGEDALALNLCGVGWDVVVMDERMPGLSGVDTAREMLASAPDTRIVLYSAYVDREVEADAARVGVARCINKGDLGGLIGALRELLE